MVKGSGDPGIEGSRGKGQSRGVSPRNAVNDIPSTQLPVAPAASAEPRPPDPSPKRKRGQMVFDPSPAANACNSSWACRPEDLAAIWSHSGSTRAGSATQCAYAVHWTHAHISVHTPQSGPTHCIGPIP